MKYNQEYYLVNDCLATWNPIEVPAGIANTEYSGYILRVLKCRDNLDNIIKELETILINDIGLDYNPNNVEARESIVMCATEIYKKLKKHN